MSARSPEQRLMAQLRERQETLQYEVFRSPPRTYEEFCIRMGQWTENQQQQEALTLIVRSFNSEDI